MLTLKRGNFHFMFISDKYQYVYIHVPKTAGMAITSTLLKIDLNDHQKIFKKEANGDRGALWHGTAEILDDTRRNYFKFCFVRNPWDRMVSFYTYHKKKHSEKITFNEFCERVRTSSLDWWRPQVDYTQTVDFIGRYENIQDDFKILCRKINFPYIPVKKQNVSNNSRSYKEFYSLVTRDVVENIYKEDIKTFEYTF